MKRHIIFLLAFVILAPIASASILDAFNSFVFGRLITGFLVEGCASDAECGQGEQCLTVGEASLTRRICIDLSKKKLQDAPCRSNKECFSELCMPSAFGKGSDGRCVECEDNSRCATRTDGRIVCKTRGLPPTHVCVRCETDYDCDKKSFCDTDEPLDPVCRPRKALGESCRTGSECESRSCVVIAGGTKEAPKKACVKKKLPTLKEAKEAAKKKAPSPTKKPAAK